MKNAIQTQLVPLSSSEAELNFPRLVRIENTHGEISIGACSRDGKIEVLLSGCFAVEDYGNGVYLIALTPGRPPRAFASYAGGIVEVFPVSENPWVADTLCIKVLRQKDLVVALFQPRTEGPEAVCRYHNLATGKLGQAGDGVYDLRNSFADTVVLVSSSGSDLLLFRTGESVEAESLVAHSWNGHSIIEYHSFDGGRFLATSNGDIVAVPSGYQYTIHTLEAEVVSTPTLHNVGCALVLCEGKSVPTFQTVTCGAFWYNITENRLIIPQAYFLNANGTVKIFI